MPPLQQARTQNEDLYHLIRDMRTAYREVLVTKAAQKAFDREQKLWGRALRKVCDAESDKTSKVDVAMCQEACRKWAGVCLLEDLLERYDAIINPMEVQP